MAYALTALVTLLVAQQPRTEPVGTGPEPSPNPISWELQLKFLDPQRIKVQLPGQSRPEIYWYMVYTVTNTTDRTVELRALVSAGDASAAWDLRCHVRENLIAYLQREHPTCLPRARTEVALHRPEATGGAGSAG